MKFRSLLALALLAILFLSALVYASQQASAPQSRREDAEKLKAQVAQLEDRVAKLEGRVDELYRWTLHPARK